MKKMITILLAVAMVFAMVGCSGTGKPESTDGQASDYKDLKIGFIYVGPVGDGGWTDAHDSGRQQLIEKFPGLQTMIMENVPENNECEQAARNLIDQGCNVIFATSFGHQESIVNVAKEFPDVKFFHATGYITSDNLSQYNGRMYQVRFLAGLAAGMKTQTGKVGYVAAFGIPEVVRGINAYALGVKAANPEATVEVNWTNSWVDASAAKACALELLNKGCDVIGYHQDFTTPLVACSEKGAFATGNNVSTPDVVKGVYLTAPLFNWGPYYISAVESILDGTYVGGASYWGSLADGMVALDTLTDVCADGTEELVKSYVDKLMVGEWDVFTGEIKDQTGAVRVAADASMTDEELLSFDWFVENVIGTIN